MNPFVIPFSAKPVCISFTGHEASAVPFDSEVLSRDGGTLFGVSINYSAVPRTTTHLFVIDTRNGKVLKRIDVSSVFQHEDLKHVDLVATKKSNEFFCVVSFGHDWSLGLLTLKASGPFERNILDPETSVEDVLLTEMFPKKDMNISVNRSASDTSESRFFHVSVDGNMVRLLSGPYEWFLHELSLDSLDYSVTELRGKNPPDEVPWLFSSGTSVFEGSIYVTGRGAMGKLSTPEFIGAVSLSRKQVDFLPLHPDPQEGYPAPRVSAPSFSKDGIVYFFGGIRAEGDPIFDRPFSEPIADVWSLNLSTLTWSRLRNVPSPLSGSGHMVASDKGVIIALWWRKEESESLGMRLFLNKAWVKVPPLSELSRLVLDE